MDAADGAHQGNDGRFARRQRADWVEAEPVGPSQKGSLQRRPGTGGLRRRQLQQHQPEDVAQDRLWPAQGSPPDTGLRGQGPEEQKEAAGQAIRPGEDQVQYLHSSLFIRNPL